MPLEIFVSLFKFGFGSAGFRGMCGSKRCRSTTISLLFAPIMGKDGYQENMPFYVVEMVSPSHPSIIPQQFTTKIAITYSPDTLRKF